MTYFYQNKAASILKISRDTLVELEKSGKIENAKRLSNGYRYYLKDDIINIAKVRYGDNWDKVIDMDALKDLDSREG